MRLKHFLSSGHTPTLVSAFLYFDVSFMIWMLIGALGNSIAADFQLNDAQKGLLVAVPLLGGAILRIPLGLLADHYGGRRTALWGMALTAIPLVLGWRWSDSFAQMLLAGLLLGIAGASFAVALPLASRWYPAQHQGLAMGIAGAGNSGTALATLFAPRIAEHIGWQTVFGGALIPLLAVMGLFYIMAKDNPRQPKAKRTRDYFAVLQHADAWWFCGFYCVTFGGFVGLASFLPILFKDQYGFSRVTAGTFATFCVIAGSLLRPLGGYLADRDTSLGCVHAAACHHHDNAAVFAYGDARHGQRRGVSACAKSLPAGDWCRHRRCGRRGRSRGILLAHAARSRPALDRQLCDRLHPLCGGDLRRVGRFDASPSNVARGLGPWNSPCVAVSRVVTFGRVNPQPERRSE